MEKRALLVISAQPTLAMRAQVAEGVRPRPDYELLRRALDADVLSPADTRATRLGRLLARRGEEWALAWAAFRRRRGYDVIYTDGEGVGLPFALLLRLGGARPGAPRHVMLGHYLTPWKKRVWFGRWLGPGVREHIETLIVHASAQRALAVETLGMPEGRVALLPYYADQRFWRAELAAVPARSAASQSAPMLWPMICAAGLEFRDYATLLDAARGLDVCVYIAAASHWSRHNAFAGAAAVPANVAIGAYDYRALRDLYAAARFVVVPLRAVNNQAGVTTILEAMAMGRAVIVSATEGQTDVVCGWSSAEAAFARGGARPRLLEAAGAAALADVPTGIYVRPGDAADLRRAIVYLLAHPDLAETLGRNGRRVVEACFGLEAFAQRLAAAIRGETRPAGGAAASGTARADAQEP